MSQQTSFVEESYDRVQNAFQSVTDEFEKLQSNVESRRKRFDRETQRQVKRFRKEFDKNPMVKRATSLQKDTLKQIRKARKSATKEIERRVEELLSALPLASRSEVKKLDRKLNKLGKQLRAMEKAQAADAAKDAEAAKKAQVKKQAEAVKKAAAAAASKAASA